MMERDFQGPVIKDITASAWDSLGSFVFLEASCHVMRTLKQSYGEAHMARNCSLSANNHMSKPFWKQTLQPQPSDKRNAG